MMSRGMARCVIKQVEKNDNYRLQMVGTWVFTIQFFKLLGMFEIFHNKMMGKNWCSPGFCHLYFTPSPKFYLYSRERSGLQTHLFDCFLDISTPRNFKPKLFLKLVGQITQVGNLGVGPDSSLFLLTSYTLKYPHSPPTFPPSPTLTRTIPTLSPRDCQTANLIVFPHCSKFNSSPFTSNSRAQGLS